MLGSMFARIYNNPQNKDGNRNYFLILQGTIGLTFPLNVSLYLRTAFYFINVLQLGINPKELDNEALALILYHIEACTYAGVDVCKDLQQSSKQRW